MVIYVLMLCSFAVATAEFVLVGLLPEISTELSVSLPTAGLLVTAYMVVVTVGGPTAAILTRRIPRRALLAATMTIALGSAALSALAATYGVLLAARIGSALAQALFMAVASQVAMAAVPPERQTAAVAKVFNGFALATVIGLPVGTLIGQEYGWRATFVLVALLSAAGLAGVLAFCPEIPDGNTEPLRSSLTAVLRPTPLLGFLTTVLAFTGFVAAFTYIAPALREVAGLSPNWVSAALVFYGLGTVAGNLLAGRVRPHAIVRTLPGPLAALAVVLLSQGALMQHGVTAIAGLFLMGAAAFVVAPLVQTWLMGQAGPAAAGLAAALNISVFGLAAALGASLGGVVISAGLGLDRIGPVAAVPVLLAVAAALVIRRRLADSLSKVDA
ncbi:MAG TPA: MFS transporter [Micromonospora sp.]|nr:MFS transporter [Micromonospora sp.]